jgi:hypothetical protein
VKGDICRLVPFSVTTIVFVVSVIDRSAFADHGGSNRFDRSPTFRLILEDRYEEARKAFESDMNSTWRDPDAAYCYGATLRELGKTSDAIKVWERIIRQYPRSKRAENARSLILSVTGQSELESDTDRGFLGFKFSAKNGKLPEVEKVYPDTPAERSHLQERDLITLIEDTPTNEFSSGEIAEMLSGKPGTRVRLSIKRGQTTFRMELTRMHSKAFARAHPDIWKVLLTPVPHSSEPQP